jgi:hypothetical protein
VAFYFRNGWLFSPDYALEELSRPTGIEISARYYESVRKILVWHYQNAGVPLFGELDPIDYKKYNLKI